MKRDMDLIRQVLLDIEESDEWKPSAIQIEGVDYEVVSYHVKLLAQSGLIEAIDYSTTDTLAWYATTLTWEGHEFLDAARDHTRWNSAKNQALAIGGTLTFEALKLTLGRIVRGEVF